MKHRSAFLAFTVAGIVLASLIAAAPAAAQGRSDLALAALETAAHVPGEVLVQFRRGAGPAEKERAYGRVSGNAEEVIVAEDRRDDLHGDLELVTLPPGLAIAAAVRGLEADPNVEFAEPNWIYTHMAVSNDTYYTSGVLWGMYGDATSPANQYGSQAGEAWVNHTDCSSVYVGIIDEGYMYTHVDLAANAGKNPLEASGLAGKDDDGNGYVDDIYGWDFDGNNNTVFDGVADDHGTHVAGTIGAVGGNGQGVAGVCWSIKLMSGKFLGKRGGTTDNAIKAVDYFTNLKKNQGLNIVATNNSWGGGAFSQGLQDAIERADDAGILFVAAAGNAGANIDVTASYPAGYPNDNIIAVAAITSTGALASYSNYGATKVDLGAPGSAITSTVPVSSKRVVTSGYASYSGTSMATPHVTGAVALYAATHPGASASTIKASILSSAVPTPSLSGKCVTGGRLNVSGF